MVLAGLGRRVVSLLYEAVLLSAWLFVAGFLVVGLLPEVRGVWAQMLFQVYVIAAAGLYFVLFWSRGGQTLAMKTWRIRVVTVEGDLLTPRRAWLRYLWAVASLGVGLLWALFDRDRQFLHDRMAGTRLVMVAIKRD
ncbi:MAG: RDD family protein [Betaproteobacteria bacterium]|nr:MAG: RDD family protein [Betaproteobacteria bacterium]